MAHVSRAALISFFLAAWTFCATAQTVVENGRTYQLHTVVKGEGLYRLSVKYGVTQEDIISANPNLTKTGLVEGIVVKIPAKTQSKAVTTYVVKDSDTAYSVAKAHGMSLVRFYELNPSATSGLRKGQSVKVETETVSKTNSSANQKVNEQPTAKYTVQKGDTSYSIATRCGISVAQFLALNPSAMSGLHEGEEVLVPASAAGGYVVHIVAEGETLYSIGVKYGVKAQQIIAANEALDPSSLSVGAALRIPQSAIPAEDGAFYYHRMAKGETLYQLCMRYNVLQERIQAVNPGVDWNALRVGQVVAVPKAKQKTTEYTDYEVGRKETLFSISQSQGVSVDDILAANPGLSSDNLQKGMTIRIPHVVEVADAQPATSDPNYVGDYSSSIELSGNYNYVAEGSPALNVFLMLPFNAYGELKDLRASGVNLNRDSYNFKSRRYVEFYEGVRLALDSLCEAGANVNLSVFDTNNRLEAINQLNKASVKPDLIIGPAHKDEMADVMAYARNNKVPMVLPFAQSDSSILDNPYVFQASVIDSITGKEIYREMAKRLSGNNVILISAKTKSAVDKRRATQLAAILAKNGIKYVDFDYKTSAPTAILPHLSETQTNVVIIPTNNEARVSSVLTSLAGVINQKKAAKVELWTTSDWLGFQTIDVDVFHKLDTKVFTTFAVDESDARVEYVINKYRRQYETEPIAFMPYFQRLRPMSGFSEYGLWGYDIAFHFVSARIALGHDFIRQISSHRSMLLQSNFQFRHLTNWGGSVNVGLKLLSFSPDGTVSVKSLE